jgi:hypothetical protein
VRSGEVRLGQVRRGVVWYGFSPQVWPFDSAGEKKMR